MVSGFVCFFFLFLMVVGTLAARFEVLVFACQNGDRNPNICCQEFRCGFQVTLTHSCDLVDVVKGEVRTLGTLEGLRVVLQWALGSDGFIRLWLTTSGLVLGLHSERGNKCTLLKQHPFFIQFTFAPEPLRLI